ncbi:MAG TPA: sugar fermentation stimulation protein SfsA, partial [Thermoplasmata archaeon]|nr:sugar fermentation stimulation protein SfsA [Thermoplasmata archaeon]
LIDMVTAGDRGVLLVLVLRPETRVFAPNARTDPAFAKTFRRAIDAGVEVHAAGFAYDGEWTTYRGVIPVLAGD